LKSACSDTGDVGRNRDAGQKKAILEGIRTDGGHIAGDGNAGHTDALKRSGGNGGDGLKIYLARDDHTAIGTGVAGNGGRRTVLGKTELRLRLTREGAESHGDQKNKLPGKNRGVSAHKQGGKSEKSTYRLKTLYMRNPSEQKIGRMLGNSTRLNHSMDKSLRGR
jgi:hypothetical protein